MYNYFFHFPPANLKDLIISHSITLLAKTHTILFWLYISIQGIQIGQAEDKICCYSNYTQN